MVTLHQGRVSGPVDLDQVRENYPTLIGPADAVRAITAHHPVVEEAAWRSPTPPTLD